MKNELELNPGNYEHFKNQSDPVTLAPFQLGDVLVRCRYCHRTYQKVTVESMGGKCPGPSCPNDGNPMETEPVAVRHVVLTAKRNAARTGKIRRVQKIEPQPAGAPRTTSTLQQTNASHRTLHRNESSRRESRIRKFCAALTFLSGVGLTVSILLLTAVCLFGGKAEAFLALLRLVGERFRLRILVPLIGMLAGFYRTKLLQLAGRLGEVWPLWGRLWQVWKTAVQDIIQGPVGTLRSALGKLIWQKE